MLECQSAGKEQFKVSTERYTIAMIQGRRLVIVIYLSTDTEEFKKIQKSNPIINTPAGIKQRTDGYAEEDIQHEERNELKQKQCRKSRK